MLSLSWAFEAVNLPILCWYHKGHIFWFLVAFSKLVAWLLDTEYERYCSSHNSEMSACMSSCRNVDSSFGYLISTGSEFAVGIGLTEVKNAAFGAMAYSSSRTPLWGGNRVEPCAWME